MTKILIYATLAVAKLEFISLTLDKREERKEKREEWWATHSHLFRFALMKRWVNIHKSINVKNRVDTHFLSLPLSREVSRRRRDGGRDVQIG